MEADRAAASQYTTVDVSISMLQPLAMACDDCLDGLTSLVQLSRSAEGAGCCQLRCSMAAGRERPAAVLCAAKAVSECWASRSLSDVEHTMNACARF